MVSGINIKDIILISKKAGAEILRIYHDTDFSSVVDFKKDDSPLTLADKAAHEVICKELTQLNADIPIISEEGKDVPYEVRKNYEYYWLVDPLDGTKEFIKRNGEFTVNIALIKNNKPVLGVIYTPVTDTTYFGVIETQEAFKQVGTQAPIHIRVSNTSTPKVAVRSKSHAAPEEEAVLAKYGTTESISVGSSLKFCMVAEGKADLYYRHGPTMEWDTGAGQAVVEAAGGKVQEGTGPNPFQYNKKSMLNGSFLCLGF